MPPRPSLRRCRLPSLAALLLVLVTGLSACGAAGDPPTVSPGGVDGLVVPTPSPDPDDFVDEVDNPWLPLLAGAEWTYESAAGESSTVTVTGETREVAGITVSEVRSTGGTAPPVQWFAQDRAGNVWLFGATGRDAWEVGEDGAGAGLVMPARPRRGDGWAAPGPPDLDGRVTVVEATDGRTVLEVVSGSPGVPVETTYERGTGPVRVEGPGVEGAELVEFTPGSAAR